MPAHRARRADRGRCARCHGRRGERHPGDLSAGNTADLRALETARNVAQWGHCATTYSADEPERLRGPQHDAAWCDEVAAWRYPEAWDMLMYLT